MYFDYLYQGYSDDLGGGIWWKNRWDDGEIRGKNMCTSAPATITAARLARQLKDESYLDIAKSLFNWISINLYDQETGKTMDTYTEEGDILPWQFSYNYGTFIGAAYELYKETNDVKYIDYIKKACDYYLKGKNIIDENHNIVEGSLLPEEGNGDGSAFRGIFFRSFYEIAKGLNIPTYQKIINNHAKATYKNKRESDGICGYDWNKIPSDDEFIRSTNYATCVSLWQYYSVVS